jgi:uncharacterized protein YhfF
MHPSIPALWRAYLASIGEAPETTDKTFDTWSFGDNPADASELVDLVLRGEKRATTPSVWELEAAGEPIPEPGDVHIVTDADGIARCILRTTHVEVVPFNQVDAAYARVEGEGDTSLAYWRRTHWAYYHRVLADTPHEPRPDMPVVCQRFAVVFVPASNWRDAAS